MAAVRSIPTEVRGSKLLIVLPKIRGVVEGVGGVRLRWGWVAGGGGVRVEVGWGEGCRVLHGRCQLQPSRSAESKPVPPKTSGKSGCRAKGLG